MYSVRSSSRYGDAAVLVVGDRLANESSAVETPRYPAESAVTPISEPFSLGYDDPSTPPFLRTNEVAVEVEWQA
jgi:hypothetical protein